MCHTPVAYWKVAASTTGPVGEQPSALDCAPGCPLYGRCPIAEDVCADTPQELVDIGAGHRVACWKRT